jgi:plasmid stabilization system protein ParE
VGYEVILNPKAADDLQDLVAYIAQDKPEAAVRLGEQLLNKFAACCPSAIRLGKMPLYSYYA